MAIQNDDLLVAYRDSEGALYRVAVGDLTAHGVSKVTGGTAIEVTPTAGTGEVTINSTGVTKLVAGTQISITPTEGTGEVTINATADTLAYRGTVDLTVQKPAAFTTITPLTQDLYLNTGEGTFHVSWADVTDNATTATQANPGDFIVYNQTSYDHIPAGAPPSTSGLWVEDTGKLYPSTLANNVGINTADPGYTLDVNGDLFATNFRIDQLTEL